MARVFDDASSEYIEVDKAVVTAYPLTMACWFNTNDDASLQTLMCITDKDVADRYNQLQAAGHDAGDPVVAYNRRNNVEATTTTGWTTGRWHHACGVFGEAFRYAYIDGGSKGTETTSSTAGTWDRLSIGRAGDSTPDWYMSGSIAEAGFWSVALTDAEIKMLALGVPPTMIRPRSLVGYWPLWFNRTWDRDIMRAYHMTPMNSPTWGADPPAVLRYRTMAGNKLWRKLARLAALAALEIAVTPADSSYYKAGPVIVGA